MIIIFKTSYFVEKQFEQNIDGVENCTQGLLINEKKVI